MEPFILGNNIKGPRKRATLQSDRIRENVPIIGDGGNGYPAFEIDRQKRTTQENDAIPCCNRTT